MERDLFKLRKQGIYSLEKVNTGRQIELDVLKAIAIIAMIMEHVYIELLWYDDSVGEDLFDIVMSGYVTQILNASVFMMSMGISVNYSRHKDAGSLALRGGALLSVGQLLTVLRTVIPESVAYFATGNQYFLAQVTQVFSVDIMQMAGLTFLLFGLLKKLKLNSWQIFLASCGLNVAAWLLRGVETGNYFINQILGYFYSTRTESFFPVLCWFIYPAFGLFFGEFYMHIKDKKKFFNRVFAVCLPIAAVYFTLRFTCDFLHLGDLTQLPALCGVVLPDALATILVDLAVIGATYWIGRSFKGKSPVWVTYPAKHINKYYCISWVIICALETGMLAIRGKTIENFWIGFAMVFVIIGLCTLIIEVYERYLKSFFTSLSTKTKLTAFAVIWIVSIIAAIWAFPRVTEYPNYLNDYLGDVITKYFG